MAAAGKMIWPPRWRSEYGNSTWGSNHRCQRRVQDSALRHCLIIPLQKADQPTFDYEVTVDVTDVAGETRSGNTNVSVAYQALKLNLNLPNKIHTDSLNRKYALASTNLNNLFEKTTVTVPVHKLKMPDPYVQGPPLAATRPVCFITVWVL